MNFYENIKYLCESKKGISLSAMVKELGMSTSFPNKWLNGQLPNSETLVKLADFLDVTTDFLLGRENKSKEQILTYGNSKKDELKKKIDSIDLPDDKIDLLLSMIDSWI